MKGEEVLDEWVGGLRFLSNEYLHPVEWEGITYPSAEHAFAASRTLDESERKRIAEMRFPEEARSAGAALKAHSEWSAKRLRIMESILRAKFADEELADELARTAHAKLIFGNGRGETYWGAVTSADGKNWNGQNWLGQFLMLIRDEIQAEQVDALVSKGMPKPEKEPEPEVEAHPGAETHALEGAKRLIAKGQTDASAISIATKCPVSKVQRLLHLAEQEKAREEPEYDCAWCEDKEDDCPACHELTDEQKAESEEVRRRLEEEALAETEEEPVATEATPKDSFAMKGGQPEPVKVEEREITDEDVEADPVFQPEGKEPEPEPEPEKPKRHRLDVWEPTYDGFRFDHRIADCEGCPLVLERERTEVTAEPPLNQGRYNGMMVIGDHPDASGTRLKTPLTGPAGHLFDKMLEQAGVDREQVWMTNAVLCKPPHGVDLAKGEHAAAIDHCRKRLLTEIHHVKPKVIVGLGQAALAALTGKEVIKNRWEDIECPTRIEASGDEVFTCEGKGTRKGRAWGCSKCKKIFDGEGLIMSSKDDPKPAGVPCDYGCGLAEGEDPPNKPPKFMPRRTVCGTCDGKKKRVREERTFQAPMKLLSNRKPVAGGVFRSDELPVGGEGQPWFDRPSLFIPTFHPSWLLRSARSRGEKGRVNGQFMVSAGILHLRKAARLLDSDPQFHLEYRTFHPNMSEEFEAWLADNPGPYSFDLETNAKDIREVTMVKCLGVDSHVTGRSAVLVLAGLPRTHPLVTKMLDICADPETMVVWHNGHRYDLPVLEQVYHFPLSQHRNFRDNMTRHQSLWPDEPHNLQHVGMEYSDASPWKLTQEKVADAAPDEELFEYCAMDVRMTTLSYNAMETDLRREGALLNEAFSQAKIHIALEMQETGIPVNREKQLMVGAEAQAESESALRWMRNFVEEHGGIPPDKLPKERKQDGALFNPNSPPQLGWVLFDPSGPIRLQPTLYTDTGQASTNEAALLPYIDHEFVAHLFEMRRAEKVKSNYVDTLPSPKTGAVHARFDPVGTRTYRYTASPPLPLTAPKHVRKMVVAPEGEVIIGADLDQLELRILAVLARDPVLIDKCKNADSKRKLDPDWDPHSYVAALAFGDTFTELHMNDPEHDPKSRKCPCQTCLRGALRDGVKSTVYGMNYGAGEQKIYEQIVTRALKAGADLPPVDAAMVRRIVDAYFRAFARVKAYRDSEVEAANMSGYLRDKLLGRYRLFPLRDVPPTEASNYSIQCTASSVVDVATWNFITRRDAVDPRARLMCVMHDALYVRCPEESAVAVAALMQDCMEMELIMGDAQPMPITGNPKIAKVWASAA